MTNLVDVQVYVSRWPFRRLPHDEPEQLGRALQSVGITEAWVGNFDALLHRDIAAVNQYTVHTCKQMQAMGWKPVGCVNPKLPDWEEDFRRCVSDYSMQAIRLHPNYHRYTLSDPDLKSLLARAAEVGVLVQIALSMEDMRTQHPLCAVPRTDPTPLRQLLGDIPNLRVMLLNMFHGGRIEAAAELHVAKRTWFDIATLEGVAGVSRLVDLLDPGSIVYGSLAPLFYEHAAYLKLIESGLPESLLSRIRHENAAAVLAGRS